MADLVVVHSADPEALLCAAARPFCAPGRVKGPLPLLAVRQGGIRDEIQERAAAAGCAGWVGQPLVVFAELPALLAGDLAPLGLFERRALLARAAARVGLRELAAAQQHRGFMDAVDRLFGDLISERVAPADLRARLADLAPDAWESSRDEELAALYDAYRDEITSLPPVNGVPRTDGRDARTVAADVVRTRPNEVRRRLRVPFGDPAALRTIAIHGLNDLRRGWDLLLDALRDAPFVDELRVYLPLDHLDSPDALAAREDSEPLGDFELADALLARRPDRIERLEPGERPAPLTRVQRSLLRMSPEPVGADDARPFVHALAAPDLARELEVVARCVKALVIASGDQPPVPPHRIAVVSRKARPYGDRAAEVLRRLGVPVTTRLRANLTEIPAVAALRRVFETAAGPLTARAIVRLVETPYFDLDVDATLLRAVGASRRPATLDAWTSALAELASEAKLERNTDDWRGPDPERAAAAVAAFASIRAPLERLTTAHTRAGWLALTLECIGRDRAGGRSGAHREGLWGLCRNACRPPHDESDALVVDATRRDVEGLACLASLLAEWTRSLALLGDDASDAGETLLPRAWWAELVAALDETEVALTTPHRRGVQVVEASAAVWRTFDHVFLVGLNGGDFPAEPAHRELFAEQERERLYAAGLPIEPARVWFAREASLFRTLAGGARRSLHVSHAYATDDGAPQLPSAYFDDVVSRVAGDDPERPDAWVETIPGSRVVPDRIEDVWCEPDLAAFAAGRWSTGDVEAQASARTALGRLAGAEAHRDLVRRVLRAADTEHARRAARLGEPPAFRRDRTRPWNGHVTSPDLRAALEARFGDAVWSASQLETYGRCPFTFFVRHVLDVRALDEPQEDMDGATRGSLVHRCLDLLHADLAEHLGDDALTSRATARAERIVPSIVERALGEAEKLGRGDVPELREFRKAELVNTVRRYLEWEIAQNESGSHYAPPRRRPVHTELVFGMDGRPPVTLHRGGRTLRLRGKIDRVDELIEGPAAGWRYVVDHKASSGSLDPVKQYEEGAILQLPLYVHALERAAAGEDGGEARVWGGAYQVVGDCARVGALHPRTLSRGQIRSGSNKTEILAETRIHESVDHAFMHIDAITAGHFPAATPDCLKNCPSYCDARDVCREDNLGRRVRR